MTSARSIVDRLKPYFKPNAPELTPEETVRACETLIVDFPQVVRGGGGGDKNFCAISFLNSDDGKLSFVKVHAFGPSKATVHDQAVNVVKTKDSLIPIAIAPAGEWVPVVKDPTQSSGFNYKAYASQVMSGAGGEVIKVIQNQMEDAAEEFYRAKSNDLRLPSLGEAAKVDMDTQIEYCHNKVRLMEAVKHEAYYTKKAEFMKMRRDLLFTLVRQQAAENPSLESNWFCTYASELAKCGTTPTFTEEEFEQKYTGEIVSDGVDAKEIREVIDKIANHFNVLQL